MIAPHQQDEGGVGAARPALLALPRSTLSLKDPLAAICSYPPRTAMTRSLNPKPLLSLLPILAYFAITLFETAAGADGTARPKTFYTGKWRIQMAACIEHPGYVTLTGGVFNYKSGLKTPLEPSWGDMFPNMTAAKSACDADSACIGFSNQGSTFSKGGLGNVSITGLTKCLYLKKVAPSIANYMLVPSLQWPDNSFVFATGSQYGAMIACENSCCCPAFSTDGQYIGGGKPLREFVPSPTGASIYLKEACLEKVGYNEKYKAATLASVKGVYGIASSEVSGGGKEAEQFCNLDYRCTGFSYDGRYAIGAAKIVFTAWPGKCAYIKDPCAPMRGFAAYNDVNIKPMYSPSSRANQTALADVYQTCLADPSCRAFNNARYMWSTEWLVPELEESYVEDAPGICLYYKLS
ncbi:hypothetical protein VOLCADRAFT_106591 [Volvox carteri f. nagariensis]|uniref:Uncharacterized protein n=1 Tax=Volvox carteri f. nagariensis TaxID=3068 RepID=D8U8E3_VOLCA|nr:uncharacterized protein VOLCADRAFT_106591 [Volvox carteri f. nagariensis]EFJ43912.1 hypothetical protein VOLCADRAFT_106591 [Volvox carteri f. nagariensis]|eukprot:XP_002954924.1 hypothetical protein VOLCADRAFT_106591 [Volvox carteri f. nagariensis]